MLTLTREELVDEIRDALSDACDMDVTFGQYAEAVARMLDKHGIVYGQADVNADLLAALREMTGRHQRDNPHHEDLCPYCRAARAAFALAEGREP